MSPDQFTAGSYNRNTDKRLVFKLVCATQDYISILTVIMCSKNRASGK